jgi:peptide/nickel transport system substrate-binding protein
MRSPSVARPWPWLLLLALVLAACSSQKTTSGGSSQASTPTRGGEITIAVARDPIALNPAKDGGYEGNYMSIGIRERLTALDGKGNVVPALATSWDTPDPLTYVFHLREGVKFSDGAPFSSADVKYTFDTILSPKNAYYGNYAPYFKATEAVDDSTFKVTLKQPYEYFLTQMASNSDFGIFPKDWLERCGSTCDTKVVGTGPFMLKDWVKGDRLVLTRNPNYWDQPKPYLDQVTFKVVPDPQTQVIQLQSGDADVLYNVPFSEVAGLEKSKDLTVYKHGPGAVNELIFNTLVPPFNDQKVRQAISLAIDRKEIIDSALFGLAEVPTDLFPSWHWGHDASAPQPPHDPEQAKSMLAQAGYDASHPLSFELKTINASDFIDQATVIKAQLEKIGVQVKVTPMEKGAFLAPLFREEGSDPKSWQAGLERYSFTDDPQSFAWEQYAKGSFINASNVNLAGGFQLPELERLVNQAIAAPDKQAAKTVFAQEAKLLAEAAVDVHLSFQTNVQAARSRVQGYAALSGNQYPLQLVWVSDAR